jgi:hypothetical protein
MIIKGFLGVSWRQRGAMSLILTMLFDNLPVPTNVSPHPAIISQSICDWQRDCIAHQPYHLFVATLNGQSSIETGEISSYESTDAQ